MDSPYSNDLYADQYVEGESAWDRAANKPPQVQYFRQMYWVPLIFSVVYFILIAMLWVNSRWFRELNATMSPLFLSILWALVFIGIIWTWVKCLRHSATRGHVGWITFAFITNMLLLLVVGYAFFINKNVATAGVAMALTWISTFVLIFVAARFWVPGVFWMIFYLFVLSWAFIVFARIGYQMVQKRNKLLATGIMKALGMNKGGGCKSAFVSGIQGLFDMNKPIQDTPTALTPTPSPLTPTQSPLTSTPSPLTPGTAGSPSTFSPANPSTTEDDARGARKYVNRRGRRTQDQHSPSRTRATYVEQTLEAAAPQSGTPRGTWRTRGLSEDALM